MSLSPRTRARLSALASQLAKFGAVGAVGFVVDVSVFNLLRATVFDAELVHAGPIYAKIVSTALAILINWVGNRMWTFRTHRQRQTLREGLEFFAVSLAGMGIGLACLWVSHYVLGYTSVLADNISSNVIGLGLGAVFRFAMYRYWVFAPHRSAASVSGGVRGDSGGEGAAGGVRDGVAGGAAGLAAAPERGLVAEG